MSHYILDKAYKAAQTGGVDAARVVVHGTAPGECVLPAAANAGALLGVTVHAQTVEGRNVAVRKAGVARVLAAGAISRGDPVNAAGATGKVKAVDEASGLVHVLGYAETSSSADGDLVEVFLCPHQYEIVV